jgi:hypothetical protein
MRHRDIELLIQKRLDHEMTEDEEVILSKHLKQCQECRTYYQEMEKIKEDLLNLNEFFPETDFNAQIFARIGIRRQKTWQKLVPAFAGLYFASLIILAFSPLMNYIFGRGLLALPGIFKILEAIKCLGNGIALLGSSLFGINLTQISLGFLFCLVIVYVLSQIINNPKEEKWGIQKSY